MPYVLSPMIRKHQAGLWGEGTPYATEMIYDLGSCDPSQPPVHYEKHALKPHSLCHFDAPGHIIPGGASISDLLTRSPEIFFGPVSVIRLSTPRFQPSGTAPAVHHWEISADELREAIDRVSPGKIPRKVLLTFEGAEPDFHSRPDVAFTLSEAAAKWLMSSAGFHLFGTIWRSVDFQPGSRERPIHRELFRGAGVLECLDLSAVPEGRFFLSAFPLPLEGATESPVCPILYTRDEMLAD